MDLAAMKGYDALRSSAAWLDLSARGKIKLTGEDRARLLHAMTTNHIQQLTPGTGCYAFFLNDKGRILSDANILCRPDHFLLDLEPEAREKIYQHLDHFIIADDVTLEDVTPDLATIAVEGPKAAEVLQAAGAPIPEPDYSTVEWGSRVVARLNATGSLGFFIFAPIAEKSALIAQLEAAGALAADAGVFRVVRLEHGKARYGEDIGERFLAQEANQPHALHFSKGCYLGQEIVERIRSRGAVHRQFTAFAVAGEMPEPGAKIIADEKEVGEITSAAILPPLAGDRAVALGYLRHEAAGKDLRAGTAKLKPASTPLA
jgi:folate-binding protein YgfZ